MARTLRFGIQSKLIGIINLILLGAAAAIVIFSTNLFSKDNVARVQESNLNSAHLLAEEIHNDVTNLTEKIRLLGVSLLQSLSPEQLEALQKPFFEQEKDLIAETVVAVAKGSSGASGKVLGRATNEALVKQLDVPLDDVLALQQKISGAKLASGTETIVSGVIKGNIPVLTLALPLLSDDQGNVTHATVATIKQDRFLKAVTGGGIIVSYLVDSEGYLLAHPDQARVLKRENLTHLEVVKQLLSGKTNNGQTRFIDPQSQIAYLGAFKTVGFAGIGVISQVEEAKALEAAKKVRITSVIITLMVAVVAFLVVFFFSLSLTRPIVRLVNATEQIAKGNYEVHLKRTAKDEIGDLTESFSEMARGLAEREKIKSAFSKFHSKDIADKILDGELALAGERKDVTVFFSDIRSFTSISEKLEPEGVVELVNGYMTRMVSIIFAHGGVVDKYVGDAIMAVYGTPSSYGNDAVRAVSAAIRMRAELKRFNADQEAKGKPVIAIGMGMHSGFVVAGNIGSPQRMEYTILGDNVNLTSRMESLTKEFKTDILISWATYEIVKDVIHCEPRGKTKVKGKAEEVSVYEVIGFKEGCEFIPPETGDTGETNWVKREVGAGATSVPGWDGKSPPTWAPGHKPKGPPPAPAAARSSGATPPPFRHASFGAAEAEVVTQNTVFTEVTTATAVALEVPAAESKPPSVELAVAEPTYEVPKPEAAAFVAPSEPTVVMTRPVAEAAPEPTGFALTEIAIEEVPSISQPTPTATAPAPQTAQRAEIAVPVLEIVLEDVPDSGSDSGGKAA